MDKITFSNDVVPVDGLPGLENITYAPLSRNYFWARLTISLFSFILIAFVYCVFRWINPWEFSMPIWNYLLVVFCAWFLFRIFVVYKTFFKKAYTLRQHDIVYKSGWIWKRSMIIPYRRIQHCEVTSGPVEQMFDIASLNIYTAGGGSSDMTIPGLEDQRAATLKAHILRKINTEDEEE